MKVVAANASPFARKVRIIIEEQGLTDSVEIVDPGAVTPVSNNEILNAASPLGILPVLVLDSGESIVDSRTICDYLNDVSTEQGAQSLYPEAQDERYQTRSLAALTDGMMDVAVAMRYETALRPAELQWPEWLEKQQEKLVRSLDYLESRVGGLAADRLMMGEIGVACILGYMDFRFPDTDWRAGRAGLATWFEKVSSRKSLQDTVPA